MLPVGGMVFVPRPTGVLGSIFRALGGGRTWQPAYLVVTPFRARLDLFESWSAAQDSASSPLLSLSFSPSICLSDIKVEEAPGGLQGGAARLLYRHLLEPPTSAGSGRSGGPPQKLLTWGCPSSLDLSSLSSAIRGAIAQATSAAAGEAANLAGVAASGFSSSALHSRALQGGGGGGGSTPLSPPTHSAHVCLPDGDELCVALPRGACARDACSAIAWQLGLRADAEFSLHLEKPALPCPLPPSLGGGGGGAPAPRVPPPAGLAEAYQELVAAAPQVTLLPDAAPISGVLEEARSAYGSRLLFKRRLAESWAGAPRDTAGDRGGSPRGHSSAGGAASSARHSGESAGDPCASPPRPGASPRCTLPPSRASPPPPPLPSFPAPALLPTFLPTLQHPPAWAARVVAALGAGAGAVGADVHWAAAGAGVDGEADAAEGRLAAAHHLELHRMLGLARSGALALCLGEAALVAGLQLLAACGPVGGAAPHPPARAPTTTTAAAAAATDDGAAGGALPPLNVYVDAVEGGSLFSALAFLQAEAEVEAGAARVAGRPAGGTTTTALRALPAAAAAPPQPSAPPPTAARTLASLARDAHARASRALPGAPPFAAEAALLRFLRAQPGAGGVPFFALCDRAAVAREDGSTGATEDGEGGPAPPPWALRAVGEPGAAGWAPRAVPVLALLSPDGLLARPAPPPSREWLDALPADSPCQAPLRAGAALVGAGAAAREAAAWALVAGCCGGGGGGEGVGAPPAGGGAAAAAAGRRARARTAEAQGWLFLPLECIEVWGVKAGRPCFSVRVFERGGLVATDFTTVQCREVRPSHHPRAAPRRTLFTAPPPAPAPFCPPADVQHFAGVRERAHGGAMWTGAATAAGGRARRRDARGCPAARLGRRGPRCGAAAGAGAPAAGGGRAVSLGRVRSHRPIKSGKPP